MDCGLPYSLPLSREIKVKFNHRQLKLAMDYIYADAPADALVEIIIKEEDFEKSKICDCMVISSTFEQAPASYDTNKNKYTVVRTVEVFGDGEGRLPRISTQYSRELV